MKKVAFCNRSWHSRPIVESVSSRESVGGWETKSTPATKLLSFLTLQSPARAVGAASVFDVGLLISSAQSCASVACMRDR